jgi:hypothetical protein
MGRVIFGRHVIMPKSSACITEEAGIESPTRLQCGFHLTQAAHDCVEREVGEDTDRYGVIELAVKAGKVKSVILQEHRALAIETCLDEFSLTGLQDVLVLLHATVKAGIKVANEVETAT